MKGKPFGCSSSESLTAIFHLLALAGLLATIYPTAETARKGKNDALYPI